MSGEKRGYRLQKDFGKLRMSELISANSAEEYEQQIARTLAASKAAFYEEEKARLISRTEFFLRQLSYIRKKWWVLQFLLLVLLWGILKNTDGGIYVQRCMGALAPVFVSLVMPELWKNREYHSEEIEGASYFNLQQVYAARMFAFGMVDLVLLGGFGTAALLSGRTTAEEMTVHFFLPMAVAGCICFRTLCSRFGGSMYFALALCLIWESVWLLLVVDGDVYEMVSGPAWLVIFFCCIWYLIYAVRKVWKSYGNKKRRALWN